MSPKLPVMGLSPELLTQAARFATANAGHGEEASVGLAVGDALSLTTLAGEQTVIETHQAPWIRSIIVPMSGWRTAMTPTGQREQWTLANDAERDRPDDVEVERVLARFVLVNPVAVTLRVARDAELLQAIELTANAAAGQIGGARVLIEPDHDDESILIVLMVDASTPPSEVAEVVWRLNANIGSGTSHKLAVTARWS